MPKRGKSGPSARARRIMKALEPKLKEGDRLLLGLKGSHASQLGTDAMRSLFSLKKFDSCLLAKKNEILPFEDVSSLEFLMQQNRCSAFLLASHTKKRPHNLVLGRAFDGHLLDQVELGVVEGGEAGAAALVERWEGAGSRDGAPLFIFQGDAWARVEELATLQSLVLDVFGGRAIEQVTLKELDHVTVVTAVEQSVGGAAGASQQRGPNADWVGVIHWRSYSMRLAVTGGKVPRVELCPALPSLDLCLRRVQLASTSLRSAAMKKPAGLKEKKIKNITRDELGATLGRVHMERQDLAGLQLKKTRATKAELRGKKAAASGARKEAKEEAGEEEEGEGEGEEEEGGGEKKKARR